jgi:hypothetical protein
MSASIPSPRDMVKALPVRSARPVADAVPEDEIEQLYVELPTEAWRSQVRKLDQFIDEVMRHPSERAKTAAPYKNFWVVGLIGSGKTTLSKKKLIGRFARDPQTVISRWVFTELGEELTNIRMQFAEWLEILERDIRYKVGMRGNDIARDFAISLQDDRDQLFATHMVMEGEAVFLENQFRYAELMIQQARTAGIEQIFIVVDEYDHIIGEFEQRIGSIAKNMIKLLKMFNENIVNKPLPVFMINCATSKIIQAIVESGEAAYLDRVFHLGQRVEASMLGRLKEVCLLDSPRSRVDVETVLRHWTGRDDLLPLSSHFITGVESLTEGLFRNVAQFYTEAILEIEKADKFSDQELVRRVFDPAIDDRVYEEIVNEINAFGFAEAMVRDTLDLFLVGPNSTYSEVEAQKCLDHHSTGMVLALLDQLVMSEMLEKDETGKYMIGNGHLIDVRRTLPAEPPPISGISGLEERIRGKCDEVKSQSVDDRLKYISRFFEVSLRKLVREDQEETNLMLGNRWSSLAGEIHTGKHYLVVPLQYKKLVGGLPSKFNILIYFHKDSIRPPKEGGGGHTITAEDYRTAYQLLRDSECLACLMVVSGQPAARSRAAIQAYLLECDEDFPFATKGDRFHGLDLDGSRIPKPIVNGKAASAGPGRNLLELLTFIGHYIEETTEDGELASLFERENRQQIWKKIGLGGVLKQATWRLLLITLYEDYKSWLAQNEKDNIFDILAEVRKQRLYGRTPSEIFRTLRAAHPDMLSMGESKGTRNFAEVLGRLHEFKIVERNGLDGTIRVRPLMPFERYLCQIAGKGKNMYGMIQELFATSATQREIDRADNERVSRFVKDMMSYVLKRGNVKGVIVEGKRGWADRAWENLAKATEDELSTAQGEIREIKAAKLDTFNTATYPMETADFGWDTEIEVDLAQASGQFEVLRSSYERLKSEDLLTELEEQRLTEELSAVKGESEAIASRISQFKENLVKCIKAVAGDLETFKKEQLAVSGYYYRRSSRKSVEEAMQDIQKVGELAKRTGDSEQSRVYLMLKELESSLEKASSSLAVTAQKIDEVLEQFRQASNLEVADYKTLARLLRSLVSVGTNKQQVETALKTARDAVQKEDSRLKDELNQLIEEAKRLSRIEYVANDYQLVSTVDKLDTERAEILEAGQLTLEAFDIKRLVRTCKAIIQAEGLLIQLFELNGKGIVQATRKVLRQVESICKRQRDHLGQQWYAAYVDKVAHLPSPRLYESKNLEVYRNYYSRVEAWQEAVQSLFQELIADIENMLSKDARKLWHAILQEGRLTEEELQDATRLSAGDYQAAKGELIQNGLARTATIILAEEM